jgi:hypothetical protein
VFVLADCRPQVLNRVDGAVVLGTRCRNDEVTFLDRVLSQLRLGIHPRKIQAGKRQSRNPTHYLGIARWNDGI